MFRVHQEGDLRCAFESDDDAHEVVLDGYVTPALGAERILSVDAAGTPTVRDLPPE